MDLTELCQELHNWFVRTKFMQTFVIENGQIENGDGTYAVSDILLDGQYFRIVGSALNDGVYQYPCNTLRDETFDGAIWTMGVPPAVESLLDEINGWIDAYGEKANSPFQSESFAGYSYTKGSRSTANGGSGNITWQSVFSDKLNRWRKV